ncbi:MAG: hypothetical protein K2Y40_21945 [Reyranella sp.]|nr:hypothetical protein [Reyranella sp.]
MKTSLDRCDGALLAAFAMIALLGTLNNCLLVNDGAVLLSAGWLGNAWDLYLDQITSRAVSTLLSFGPAWLARWAFDLAPADYVTVAHMLYFAVPPLLWMVIRAVETHRIFSRLYLAITLVLVYFPTELIVGTGVWMIWMALIADPTRSRRQAMSATLVLGLAIAFTHPLLAAMSLLYTVTGVGLLAIGRPFSRRTLGFATAMTMLLLLIYVATSTLLPPTNPTILRALTVNRYDYINPIWMLVTVALFPVLPALWLLLISPGLATARMRWHLSPRAETIVAVLGLWFAANGVSLLTWLFARHTGVYVLTLALTLALAAPASDWLTRARRPLMLFAAIMTVAACSYAVDLALFNRFIEKHSGTGVVDVDASTSSPWPPQRKASFDTRIYFKWAAGDDYVRDVVVPDYDWYLVTLAFQSFFNSGGRTLLFHRIPIGGWIPFECAPVEQTLKNASGEARRMFLRFLDEHYCVR